MKEYLHYGDVDVNHVKDLYDFIGSEYESLFYKSEKYPDHVAGKIRAYLIVSLDAWYIVDSPYNEIVSGKIQTDQGEKLLRIISRVMKNCDLVLDRGSINWIKAVSAGVMSYLRIEGVLISATKM